MKTRKRLSKHFTVKDFACHDGTRVQPRDYNGLSYLCRVYLEPLRTKYGTVHINSGYRTRAYNASIGGGPNNFHIYTIHHGKDQAAPGTRPGGRPPHWHRPPPPLRRRERNGKGGLGLYSTFVHVDIRDYPADWTG